MPLATSPRLAAALARQNQLRQQFGQGRQSVPLSAPQQPQESSEQSDLDMLSLTRTAARKTLGGLSAVGNLLDLPGSMIRDTVSGRNPLDQILTPMSAQNRVTGEEMLQNLGMLSRRKPTGLGGNLKNLGAGMALEIAIDPLTYLTFGASAVGKGGKLARAAGLLDEAADVARAGKRVSRQSVTPRQLADRLPGGEGFKRLEVANKGVPVPDEILDEKLGGLARFQLPGMKPWIIGDQQINKLGRMVPGVNRDLNFGEKLDAAGEAVRFGKYSPVRRLAPIFQKAVRGAKTPEGQKGAQKTSRFIEESSREARDRLYGAIKQLDDSGVLKSEDRVANSNAMLRYLEGVGKGPNDTPLTFAERVLPREMLGLRETLDDIKRVMEDVYQLEKGEGVNLTELDDVVEYFARQRQTQAGPLRRARDNKAFPVTDQFSIGRKDHLRDITGGTATLQDMSIDKDFAGIFDQKLFGSRKVTKEEFDEKFLEFRDKYGLQPRDGETSFGDPDAWERNYRKLFESITKLDRNQVEAGVPMFAINPAEVALKRMESGSRAAASAIGLRGLLSGAARRVGSGVEEAIKKRQSVEKSLEEAIASGSKTKKLLAEAQLKALPGNEDVVQASTNLFDSMQQAGFSHENALDKMVQDLGTDGQEVAEAILKKKQAKQLDEWTKAHEQATGEKVTNPEEFFDLSQADITVTPREILQEFEVATDIAEDAARVNKAFQAPEAMSEVVAAADAFTNWFKTNVTAVAPAFHVRNAISGFVQNQLAGVRDPRFRDPIKAGMQPYVDAGVLSAGRNVKGASEIPLFKGKNLTDEEASEELRRLVFAEGLLESPGQHNDLLAAQGESIAQQIPGRIPWREQVRAPEDQNRWRDVLNPIKTAGVSGDRDVFAPARYGRAIGNATELGHRVGGFIALLRQGFEPNEAARRIKALQVDYTNLSDVERRVLRRTFPFYSFTRGMVPFVVRELGEKPGGAMAMTIKSANRAKDVDAATPDYVAGTTAIPAGENEDGSRDYITGLGLMHEAPLDLFPTGIQSGLFGVGSMLNPMFKAPIEAATNESLFQEGPQGGRSLDDQDPLLGRTLSNLTGRTTPYRFPKMAELAVANSPATRYLSTLRQASDPRKNLTDKMLNLLTGVRVTTVSPEAQDAVIREQAESLMREMGGRQFERTYIPEDVLADMNPQQRAQAERWQSLMRLLGERAKDRAAARKEG